MSRIGVDSSKTVARRTLLAHGGATLAGFAMLDSAFAEAFAAPAAAEVTPWLDQPPPIPEARAGAVKNLQRWEDLDSWITPNERFFSVAHYNRPIIDAQNWSLEVSGLVSRPMTFNLTQLKARPRQEVTYTIECSGNHGLPWLASAIGNARWAGAPLASILAESQPMKSGIEVVFVGADQGEEIVRRGSPLEFKFTGNFARSMSLADAMNSNSLLCYEMNGAPLPQPNGYPLRLITPGWYGIANVKWLKRIEVRDKRFEGRFMGRDYVTIREEKHNGESFFAETSVSRMLINSAPARVERQGTQYKIFGMAWGAPIANVEVRIDDGPWQKAAIDHSHSDTSAWTMWSVDWLAPAPGVHGITSRAFDPTGNMQPATDDSLIAGKRTYWESNAQVTRRINIG